MLPSFHVFATISATICFVLAAVWLIAPQRLLCLWGTYSQPVGLVSRRGAALFLGVGITLLLAHSAAPSASRSALSAGSAVGSLALGALGVLEFAKKRASVEILSAVALEIALGAAFLCQL